MEKKLITVSLDEIIPYENNPRKNTKAVGVVAESIRQTEYNNPIIVDEDMVILAGHTRQLALRKNVIKEVQVLQVTGLTEEQKKKYRLLDNKTGEFASWDYVTLMEEIQGLDWEGLELDWGLEMETKIPDEEEPDNYEEEEEFKYECPECGFRFNA